MRLSDAIALGRTLAEPGVCVFILHRDSGTLACAIGMATLAVGCPKFNYDQEWPWLCERTTGIRICKCHIGLGYNSRACDIAHIFDLHVMGRGDWTLDRLIDYVRSIEPPEPEGELPCVTEPKNISYPELTSTATTMVK